MNAAKKFFADVQQSPFSDGYCLTLCGRSGTGKTMLSECILTELKLNGWGHCEVVPEQIIGGHLTRFTAKLYDMRKVSDALKAGRWSIVEAMEDKTLSVLDDIGADHDPSKITASKVDRVLRSRRGKWTVVTVNLPLAEIADKLDARIASFLIRDDNRFVEIKAGDYALRKLKQQTTK